MSSTNSQTEQGASFMQSNKLFRFGVIGTVITALCCFTPILLLLLAALGLSWAVGYLDYVLLPALFIFSGLTLYALWRRQRIIALTEERS